ncbi:hypothetical protein Sango_1262900 [Sesamum angolense]|uniref:Uncharacterized protein n=1 Tax=Sesamum angolense TaxID=2727404 RepID=A0AAE1WRA6_9LAMI|nr:hypothetical protein Sango_1262900 [Sesamum angolense]
MFGLADRFHNVFHAAEQPLWNGCTISQLAVVAELVDIKADARYKPTRERNPNLTKTPYAVLRYLLITPRPQRLYASQATAEQMTWHANHQTEERSICHQFDAEVWRNFDRTYLDFAVEPRNVRLGLCTDCARDETFTMRTALMWKVNHLPPYGMASGWSSAVMGCPICMEVPRAFYLQNDMKELRLHGMKNHDCHVFMQKLITIAFCEMLPEFVWSALLEVNLLFRIICLTTLDVRAWEDLYNIGGCIHLSGYSPSRNDDLVMNGTRIQQSIFNFLGRVTAFPCYFVNGYNFHTEHHSVGKSTFNCGCVLRLVVYDTDRDFYGILEEVHPHYHLVDVNFMKKSRCDSCWTEVAFQEDKSISIPQVLMGDHNYALHDPNGIQLVIDLNQQGAGTSRAANGESDDEPDEDSFDEDYETALDNCD